jgi:hypothetical protein
MRTLAIRLLGPRLMLTAVAVIAVALCPVANAAPTTYYAILSGSAESPSNNSPGVGTGYAEIDPVAHTMRVIADFNVLVGTTTASHIHAPTAVALTGTAGVATTTPTFTGFPLGVTAGLYDNTFDMTQASSYNPSFITNNGGTTATAEAALFAAIAGGKAYLNIHTTAFPGGEIRGFLVPFDPTPTGSSTWGRIKSLYR